MCSLHQVGFLSCLLRGEEESYICVLLTTTFSSKSLKFALLTDFPESNLYCSLFICVFYSYKTVRNSDFLSDRTNLINSDLITHLSHKYRSALVKVLNEKHKERPNLNEQLLAMLGDLRTINTLHHERLSRLSAPMIVKVLFFNKRALQIILILSAATNQRHELSPPAIASAHASIACCALVEQRLRGVFQRWRLCRERALASQQRHICTATNDYRGASSGVTESVVSSRAKWHPAQTVLRVARCY